MTKWPGFGRCKTRLSKDIGRANSLLIQTRIIKHTVLVAKTLQKQGLLDISLAISGIGPKSSKRWCNNLCIQLFHLQGKGTLGEKIRRQILLNKRNSQNKNIIIIGTDLPDLCHLDLLNTIEMFKSKDVVIGPSNDGGYWLIGFSERLFSQSFISPFIDIEWSTSNVLQKTVEAFLSLGLNISYLNTKIDIDEVNDLLERFK